MDIITLDNFLSTQECEEYMKRISNINASAFTTAGSFTNKIWNDTTFTSMLFSRLVSITKDDRYLRANSCVMAGMYKPGDQFGLHTDTGLYYNHNTNEKSKWTLLIYLNDEFEGGSTIFYDTNTWEKKMEIVPKTGMALIFDIELWHCGNPVITGLKHWIGCEIIGNII